MTASLRGVCVPCTTIIQPIPQKKPALSHLPASVGSRTLVCKAIQILLDISAGTV